MLKQVEVNYYKKNFRHKLKIICLSNKIWQRALNINNKTVNNKNMKLKRWNVVQCAKNKNNLKVLELGFYSKWPFDALGNAGCQFTWEQIYFLPLIYAYYRKISKPLCTALKTIFDPSVALCRFYITEKKV